MNDKSIYQTYLNQLHHICCEPYLSSKLGGQSVKMAQYLSDRIVGLPEFASIKKIIRFVNCLC